MSRFRPLHDAQSALGALQDEMNRLFDRVWHVGISTKPFDGQSWAPFVDVYEFDDRYVIMAEVPGVDTTSIEVTYKDGGLTIRGSRPRPAGFGQDTATLVQERRYGSFSRTIDLSCGVEADSIIAKCSAGVLDIIAPKNATTRARTIRVESTE